MCHHPIEALEPRRLSRHRFRVARDESVYRSLHQHEDRGLEPTRDGQGVCRGSIGPPACDLVTDELVQDFGKQVILAKQLMYGRLLAETQLAELDRFRDHGGVSHERLCGAGMQVVGDVLDQPGNVIEQRGGGEYRRDGHGQ